MSPFLPVGEREVTAAQQPGDLAGVDLVVLGLAAVDSLHGVGVADEEGELFLGAEVGEPVPGEHAFDADDEVLAEGSDGSEESVRAAGEVDIGDDSAGGVEDAEVHGPGVQVDASVEAVLAVVETHGSWSPWVGWGLSP